MPQLRSLNRLVPNTANSEFIRMSEAMPQKYCLFCEANASLGIEAHKAECPYRKASMLISE